MGSLKDAQAGHHDVKYATVNMYRWRCWQAKKNGWPPPPEPAVIRNSRSPNNGMTEAVCPDCDVLFTVRIRSMQNAKRRQTEPRCPDCRRASNAEKVRKHNREKISTKQAA